MQKIEIEACFEGKNESFDIADKIDKQVRGVCYVCIYVCMCVYERETEKEGKNESFDIYDG